MTTQLPVTIPISKGKLLLSILGAFAFVASGFWFVLDPPSRTGSSMEPLLIRVLGLASILFFGAIGLVVIRKLFDPRPGLVINEQGLMDNSGGLSAGLIVWQDIEDFQVLQIQRQRLILVLVKNPQDYIDRQSSGWKRKLMAMNYRQYGTPISISTNGLKISFAALLTILNHQLEVFQQQKP
ncbi:MAG: STM3941 family protein [Haliscomenobacter sp.]|uniref:STM3941 family protein n=1 Tax=Haliscomenobacter sp. TaxID=2717303 RepID=UPI0029A52B94|nr:STM3941 family protein [Haliscomenobacter sp.]MDX2070183.1 STM3941 family protein [Haliscomenobacter sp.]